MRSGEARAEMNEIFKAVGDSIGELASEMSKMQDKISLTFSIVSDHRYKVGKDKLKLALS